MDFCLFFFASALSSADARKERVLDYTSLALSHSFRIAADGANSPALLAILASKESARRVDSFACSAASNRARVKRTGDTPRSGAHGVSDEVQLTI